MSRTDLVTTMTRPTALLGYPGGKLRLLPQLLPLMDHSPQHTTYVEPFVGSGAVCMNLTRPETKYVALNDTNKLLTGLFMCLNDGLQGLRLIAYVDEQLGRLNLKVNRSEYYDLRSDFNARLKVGDAASFPQLGDFFLLAGSCANNLIRFGPHGFNQAWGERSPDILRLTATRDWLEETSLNCLARVSVTCQDFGYFINGLRPSWGSCFFYLDPPYLSCTGPSLNGIYDNTNPWTADDDVRLARLCKEIHQAGGRFLLSNMAENRPLVEAMSEFKVASLQQTYKSSLGPHKAKGHHEIAILNYNL
jgi:DNA adenine methylase Dam